ncbi:Indigoidine synthase A like protein-domain-containing protein, partial [Pavlovales sp. CCMP2436]
EGEAAAAAAVQRALREADEQGIRGAETTPFLLTRINELTGGASLRANMALIRNNAAVGARIAAELARRVRAPAQEFTPISLAPSASSVGLGGYASTGV